MREPIPVPTVIDIHGDTVDIDDVRTFLDELREDGSVNMYGARPYVKARFDVSEADAKTLLVYWMKSFTERHNAQDS